MQLILDLTIILLILILIRILVDGYIKFFTDGRNVVDNLCVLFISSLGDTNGNDISHKIGERTNGANVQKIWYNNIIITFKVFI